MSQGTKKMIGYAYDKSSLDPTKERFDNFLESLFQHHYTESNDSANDASSLTAEKELKHLREASTNAIQKSWKEVETLQQECSQSSETVSNLTAELQDSRDDLSKAKEQIVKLELELKYYHDIPDILTKRLDERRKRMSMEFKSTMMDHQPQRRSQSVSNVSPHVISNNVSSELPRRASIPFLTSSSRMFATKKESIAFTSTNSGSNDGDNTSNDNNIKNKSGVEEETSNDANATPSPTTKTIESTPSSNSIISSSPRSQQDLDLKISSRDAAIEILEQTVRDNVGQVVQMDQELKRLRYLLSENNISYDEHVDE